MLVKEPTNKKIWGCRAEQKEIGHPIDYTNIEEQAQEIKSALGPHHRKAKIVKSVSNILEIFPQIDNDKEFQLAYLMTTEGDYKAAVEIYDRIIEQDQHNIKALNNKGLALHRLGNYENAILYFDRVLKLCPKNIDALLNLALSRIGQDKNAEICFRKTLELEHTPGDYEALMDKGIALRRLGRHHEALEYFDDAIRINPAHIRALVNKGITLDKHGKYEEARSYYDKALRINSNSVLAVYNKSCSYALQRDYGKSLRLLRKAIRLDPNYKNIARTDPSFETLRYDERFIKMIYFVGSTGGLITLQNQEITYPQDADRSQE